VRGQYAAGTMNGTSVAAYHDEPRVARDSRTETYTALSIRTDNPRWNDVPFYLRTGKRVAQHLTHDRDSLPPVGYEKLLYHSTLGNALLFQGADMVEASWAALQPVLDVWESSEDVPARYTAGSDGAAAAVEMLARSGHGWLPLEHPADATELHYA
jgi:glucose-6-phosphate 1-dehydrogenase